MARPLRIEYPGAWYHVMNRGARKKTIFHNSKYHQLFLKLLSEISKRYQIHIHAYCLMPNHYHLLVNTPLGNLSKAMKYLNGLYTQRHNKLLKTDGPLFRGRFKSILVDANDYLLTLSRYIHLNPVVAGIVNKPEQYRWSSYVAYINPRFSHDWLITKTTLNKFGTKSQKQKYQIFIQEGHPNGKSQPDTLFKKLKRMPILGSEAFIKTITDTYMTEGELNFAQFNHEKIKPKVPSILSIMSAVAQYYQVNIYELKSVNRSPNNRKPRTIAIYLSCLLSNQKSQIIADYFTNTSAQGISKAFCRLKQEIESDIALQKEINYLIKCLSVVVVGT